MVQNSAKELLNYFNKNIFIEDGNYYINYDILTTILVAIKDNKNKYLLESYTDYTKLSTLIINFFSGLIFNGKQASLVQAQETYNGIAVIENSIYENYNYNFAWGPGGENDHTCLHTGIGKPGTDFIIKNSIELNYFKTGIGVSSVELLTGTKVDIKSFYDRARMEEVLSLFDTKKYSHNGDFIFAYLLTEKTWYLVDYYTHDTFVLIDFNPKFSKQLLKFYLDENNLFSVKDFII